MSKKYKLFVVQLSEGGINKFRVIDPHVKLAELSDNIDVELGFDGELFSKDFKDVDGIFIHVSMLQIQQIYDRLTQLKNNGVKLFIDVDDYWEYNPTHSNNRVFKTLNLRKKVIDGLRLADLVTTTVPFLYEEVKKFNKNVVIIPNAIDYTEKQFTNKRTESDVVRIGYIGGSSHLEDIRLVRGVMSHLKRLGLKFQMILCGFDSRIKNVETGEVFHDPYQSIWVKMEEQFTDNFNLNDPQFKEYLQEYTQSEYPHQNVMEYKRVWTKPINTYAESYNQMDLVLAPLQDNKFNGSKSQLKLLEASAFSLPVIASEVDPYTIDGVHNENCMLIPSRKEHKLWIKYVEELVRDADKRKRLGNNLHKTMKKYDLSIVTKQREDIYCKNFLDNK